MYVPLPEQIERAALVATQVAEWRNKQDDLVECAKEKGRISMRSCIRFQKSITARKFGLCVSREMLMARALYCQGCEHAMPIELGPVAECEDAT